MRVVKRLLVQEELLHVWTCPVAIEISTRFPDFTMRSGVAHLFHTSTRIVIKDSLFRLLISEYNSDFDFSYSSWSQLLIWLSICVTPLVSGGRMNSHIWFCSKKILFRRTGSHVHQLKLWGCLVLISFRWWSTLCKLPIM